jgi:predicted membrane protein
MAFAVIETLMAAPLGHLVGRFGLPVLTFLLWGLGVLVAFIAYDVRTVKRVHPVTLILGIGLVALANLEAIVIGPSAPWHRVLEWLAG